MQRRLLGPDDQKVRAVFGNDLTFDDSPAGGSDIDREVAGENGRRVATPGEKARRTIRLRLRRAERAGLIPKRVYTSSARYGWWEDEFDAALATLPNDHAATRPVA